MKILIIGGAGFLGANMVRRCLAEPDTKVTVMDSLDPHLRSTTENLREIWDRIHFVRCDLLAVAGTAHDDAETARVSHDAFGRPQDIDRVIVVRVVRRRPAVHRLMTGHAQPLQPGPGVWARIASACL